MRFKSNSNKCNEHFTTKKVNKYFDISKFFLHQPQQQQQQVIQSKDKEDGKYIIIETKEKKSKMNINYINILNYINDSNTIKRTVATKQTKTQLKQKNCHCKLSTNSFNKMFTATLIVFLLAAIAATTTCYGIMYNVQSREQSQTKSVAPTSTTSTVQVYETSEGKFLWHIFLEWSSLNFVFPKWWWSISSFESCTDGIFLHKNCFLVKTCN